MPEVEELISFWRKLSLNENLKTELIHPEDEKYIKAEDKCYFNSFKEYKDSNLYGENECKFHVGLAPSPYCGDIRKAKIFILLLNPGFAEQDYFDFEKPDFRKQIMNDLYQTNLNNEFPYGGFNPDLSYQDGARWIRNKFENLAQTIRRQNNISYINALKLLSQNIATLERFPYHSRFFKNKSIYSTMPSVVLMENFVKSLVERAIKGEILLIVTRQVKIWKLPNCKNIIKYEGSQCRGASLSSDSLGGKAILEFLPST